MSELKVDCININMYGMNSYIVSCDDEAMIIDIAKLSFGYDDYKKLLNGKKLVRVIYTHGHFDHISGADDIRKEFPNVPHCVHNLDYNFFQDPNLNVSAYLGNIITCQSPEEKFNDGDTFKLKDIEFKYSKKSKNVINIPYFKVDKKDKVTAKRERRCCEHFWRRRDKQARDLRWKKLAKEHEHDAHTADRRQPHAQNSLHTIELARAVVHGNERL